VTPEELLERYGIAYPHCGFYIGPGWMPIVEGLIKSLITLGWDKDLHQVKEKFGGLRFYIGECTDQMWDLIDAASAHSFETCEDCGKPGRSSKRGWIKTLCEEHHAQRKGL
jgi:hypothetical protein